jgi:hypothetical protein
MLPDCFITLRRLLEARLGKPGSREYIQVLRLLETFTIEVASCAVEDALRLGTISFDAVRHLLLCRIEQRPPRLDMENWPHLPLARVRTTQAADYMVLLPCPPTDMPHLDAEVALCGLFLFRRAYSVEATAPAKRERLFDCRHFLLWWLQGELPFTVGGEDVPHVLVCIDGSGLVEHGGATYAIDKGDVWLIPAVIGACVFQPNKTVTLLEVALPSA